MDLNLFTDFESRDSGNTVVQMYALNHPEFTAQPWHVFVVFVISVWLACAAVCLANSAMPVVNKSGIFLWVSGCG